MARTCERRHDTQPGPRAQENWRDTMSSVLRKEWLKAACLKQPGVPIDNVENAVLFQAQLLRPDWNKFTCTISDGFHMIDAEIDPIAVKKFEEEHKRPVPALNGSLITCMKVMHTMM